MAYFLLRLLPPRPSFQQDMTPAERQIMQDHVRYWTGMSQQGKAIAFGPVVDPRGGWGVGLLEAADAAEAHAITGNDPAILSRTGFKTEVLPMPMLVLRPTT